MASTLISTHNAFPWNIIQLNYRWCKHVSVAVRHFTESHKSLFPDTEKRQAKQQSCICTSFKITNQPKDIYLCTEIKHSNAYSTRKSTIYISLSIQLLSPSFVYFTIYLRFMFTLSYSYFHSLYCTFDIATAFWFYYTFLRLLYHSVAHSWSTDWKCILRWYPTANTSMGWHERVNGFELRIVNAVAKFFIDIKENNE